MPKEIFKKLNSVPKFSFYITSNRQFSIRNLISIKITTGTKSKSNQNISVKIIFFFHKHFCLNIPSATGLWTSQEVRTNMITLWKQSDERIAGIQGSTIRIPCKNSLLWKHQFIWSCNRSDEVFILLFGNSPQPPMQMLFFLQLGWPYEMTPPTCLVNGEQGWLSFSWHNSQS